MNKTTGVAQNSSESTPKDALTSKKKSGSIRDIQSDTHNEDLDKAHHPKTTSHFDCSNLGLFFSARTPQAKPTPPEGIIGRPLKKLSEASSAKEGNNQKQPSSKDFSNLDELVQNTTIIPNPNESAANAQKKATEAAVVAKAKSDEPNNGILPSNPLENVLFNSKKKSIEKPYSKTLKDANTEQDITGDISKLGFNLDDEPEKPNLANFEDLKVSMNNLKAHERTKSKPLPSRYSSINPNIFETPKTPEGSYSGSRSNSNSIFASNSMGKLVKAVSPIILQYQDKDIYNDDNNDQDNFITELFENLKKNGTSEDIPLDKSKEISQDDLNPRLLMEKTASRNTKQIIDLVPDSAREIRKKPHLSLISSESTVDSENFTLPHDPQNNSFSTPFSGANGSFNNPGKLDFSSPVKIDSARISSDNTDNFFKNFSMKNLNISNHNMNMMNTQRMSATLNQSCMSFYAEYGSGNNSDRSANLSFNDEFLNNFNTPQGSQQQNFHKQNFNVPSNPNMMEQFFIAPPSLADSTLRNKTDGNVNLMDQTMNQSPSNPNNERKTNNSGNKNTARMRRKNQDNEEDLYEVDLDKVESCGRTTLMVRNIPNKYDLTLILQTIEKNHKGKFDFFYLPIDFSNRCNFGYAFINFPNTKHIKDFYNEFNGKKWEKFNSEKICEIKYGRIQGQAALMQHFQYSRVMNQQDKKLRPYVPTKYGLPNKQKIEELVRQQKLASAKDGKELDSVRQHKEVFHY